MSTRQPNIRPTLVLPPLEAPVRTQSVGKIRHVLRTGGIVDIVETRQVRLSPRVTETLCTLSDGQSVIVTSRKIQLPPEVDGTLRRRDDGSLEWLSHRERDRYLEMASSGAWSELRDQIAATWRDAFRFQAEERGSTGAVIATGLRPPQLGALHAIGAHWSLSQQPATIVMPTGTGKTETMLAALVALVRGPLLVVVPSRPLRDQTLRKFLHLGLLRSLGNLSVGARNPIVGAIYQRPKTAADLEIFDRCHVVIATMSVLGQGLAAQLARDVAGKAPTLIVDEAHHIAADTWSAFREQFGEGRVLQFTATPFRRDGKIVDGKVIYNYPLRTAQQDGYFKPIAFTPIYEIDADDADRTIAQCAVDRLRSDLAAGLDHRVMARCATKQRAEQVHGLYQQIGGEFAPVLVHSDTKDTSESLARLRSGQSRIVVCVDMLGEGFDLPELKIAAIHDSHKSLAVLLQFTGRFTRAAGPQIGDATVIANIADVDVSTALERLYSEDADWNHLLSEYSSQAVQEHSELIEFLNNSERLDDQADDDDRVEISHHLLRPKISTVVYGTSIFQPKKFHEGLATSVDVQQVWLHQKSRTLYFVARSEPSVGWTRSRELRDRLWDLFVLHHDAARDLLYLHSSDTSSTHEALAQAVGGRETQLISGDTVFRTLGRINRLIFHNVGVRKYGRRNLRYALYTGADVAEALSVSEKKGSVKSNLFGTGWAEGRPVSIGCSYKGRIWSREQGTVPELVKWCQQVGEKLRDTSIDTTRIIDNVLIPEEVDALPAAPILGVDWPTEILRQSEEQIILKVGDTEESLALFQIEFEKADSAASRLSFRVYSQEVSATFVLMVGGDRGFEVTQVGGPTVVVRIGRLVMGLAEYLSDYPPLVRFVDLAELDGNLLIRPREQREFRFPPERFEIWDWRGTDISAESMWKGDQQRSNSIQARAARHYEDGRFEVIFDDDTAGEAADLVCLKEEADHIRLALVHCKFSGGQSAGERVHDVEQVCSQAVRSSKWKWKFKDLCRHVVTRERKLAKPYRPSRFLVGCIRDLNRFAKMSRFKEIRTEIVIVQPGLSQSRCTNDQAAVLAAAHSYLKETIGVDLDVVCST